MVLDKNDLVALRLYNETTDKNFIFSTWLLGLFYGDSWFSQIPKNIFMTKYHKIIEDILKSEDTIISIACLKEDPDVILGYSVAKLSEPVLHWVHVKKAWRGIRIAKSLVSSEVKSVTHLTKCGLSIIKKHNIVFNPFS